jgi:hypothetical protein
MSSEEGSGTNATVFEGVGFVGLIYKKGKKERTDNKGKTE